MFAKRNRDRTENQAARIGPRGISVMWFLSILHPYCCTADSSPYQNDSCPIDTPTKDTVNTHIRTEQIASVNRTHRTICE